jgi:hypothetical protein
MQPRGLGRVSHLAYSLYSFEIACLAGLQNPGRVEVFTVIESKSADALYSSAEVEK